MYPQAELALLALKKRALLGHIQTRREQFADQLEEVLRPVQWMDRVHAKWSAFFPAFKRVLAPLRAAAMPNASPQTGDKACGLFRWAPLAFTLFRSLR
jgi:hypothetical protein